MQRNYSSPAIILSLKPSGENNSIVSILTPENGIIYATLYGGPKSKMRSLVTQWNSGIIYLYDNPEKKQTKISDFDVKNYHSSFSQNLFKLYAASLVTEIVLKTNCAGSSRECWNLMSGFFDGMEIATEEQSKLGLIRFLWRFLELLGIQPDASCCGICEKHFNNIQFAPEQISHYNIMDNMFICSECNSLHEGTFQLSIQAVNYLSAITNNTPGEVRKLPVNKDSFYQMRNLIFYLIENNIETKLNSLETGVGIL